jgi:PAS domain S-box-containing protein
MDADLRFTYLSPSTEKLFGYTLKEWETLDWNTFLKPDYVETIHKVFDGFKSGKQESVNLLSVIVRHKNGTEMWIEFSACPLFDKNEVFKSAVGITRDITERKQAELQIKHQNVELQKLNATKDKFFSIIAHDLKNPFNSIMGFCELLVEQIRKKDFNGIEKYAGFIRQSSQMAFDLLINLMVWSRSQTGRMECNPVQFDLMESILEITAMFDDIAWQKGIVIKRELPPKVAVFADRSMINTVLRNLISNAIKFTNPGGEIILTVIEEKNKLTVSVKDNGIGIPNNSIDKLFRIDENYSTRGTASETGTGLGLILCKEFIEKHNGEIRVESEPGKGSTFYFTLHYNAN